MKQYILAFLLRLDNAALVILSWGKCKPGEWISSALWSLECDGKFFGKVFRPCVDFLFGANHCRNSYLAQKHIYGD